MKYTFFMCYRHKDDRHVFVQVCPDKVVEVFDRLHDTGYKIAYCAEWFYWAQCDKKNPEYIPGVTAYLIEPTDNDYNFEPPVKSKTKSNSQKRL